MNDRQRTLALAIRLIMLVVPAVADGDATSRAGDDEATRIRFATDIRPTLANMVLNLDEALTQH